MQSAQPKQRTQRGSLTTNQCVAGEWVWLPEQPQAGAHSLVAAVSRLQLAKVLHTYNNGAVGVQVFDEQALAFTGAELRLPPPRTVLEASQRLLKLTSLRPNWVGQRVRLLDHPLVPSHFAFNAEHYNKHVALRGGLQAVFDAGREQLPEAACGWRYAGWFLHELDAELRGHGRPRQAIDGELRGSKQGINSELAVILSIDLHRRCELPGKHPVDLTWGTADVRCFDPFSMEYNGHVLNGVPLYMVHGLHYSAALAEARAAAIPAACLLARFDEEEEALEAFNAKLHECLLCPDVETLASLVASWGEPAMAELVATRQREADWGARMQEMLREQAGLQDLGGPTWHVPNDRSCDPSFHFELSSAIHLRWSPLLSYFLCGERSTWNNAATLAAAVTEPAGSSQQHGGGVLECAEEEDAPQEDDDEDLISYDSSNDELESRHVANAWGYYC